MTVGQTLTEARSQAGLTVDELSERTRIRGTVIRSIEQDDYEACGGDLYVRGYVRALAGAVGIDAQPLIREYELGRAGQGGERAYGSIGRHAKGYPDEPATESPTAFDLPAVTAEPVGDADQGATRLDLPQVNSDPAATAFDLPVVPAVPPAEVPPAAAQPPGSADTRFDLPAVTDDLMATGYDLGPWPGAGQPDDAAGVIPALGQDPVVPQAFPGLPGTAQFDAVPSGAAPSGAAPSGAARPGDAGKNRRSVIILVVAVVAVVALGSLGIGLVMRSKANANAAAASASASSAAARASASQASAAAAQASASAAAQASASAAAQASASASASQAAANAVVRLPVASAVAFGPDGPADGDNPGNAKYAISGGASPAWSSQWYSTPEFGMLKHGTGLLLDLGREGTVTTVVINLGRYSGASLEIRAGNGTAPQDLRVAATASNAGGVLRLALPHPVTARYLLIWFTQLPPDGAGHYQANVSQVQVTGHR